MKRLENGEGSSPQIGLRLPQKTTELLDALVAKLPPQPVAGKLSRSVVLRAVIETGIEVLATREGIKLGTEPKPIEKVTRKPRASTNGAKTTHRASRVTEQRRRSRMG